MGLAVVGWKSRVSEMLGRPRRPMVSNIGANMRKSVNTETTIQNYEQLHEPTLSSIRALRKAAAAIGGEPRPVVRYNALHVSGDVLSYPAGPARSGETADVTEHRA